MWCHTATTAVQINIQLCNLNIWQEIKFSDLFSLQGSFISIFKATVERWILSCTNPQLHTHTCTQRGWKMTEGGVSLPLWASMTLHSNWLIQWWWADFFRTCAQLGYVTFVGQTLAYCLNLYNTFPPSVCAVVPRQSWLPYLNHLLRIMVSPSVHISCFTYPCPEGAMKYRQQWTLLSGMDLRFTLDSAFRKSSNLLSI